MKTPASLQSKIDNRSKQEFERKLNLIFDQLALNVKALSGCHLASGDVKFRYQGKEIEMSLSYMHQLFKDAVFENHLTSYQSLQINKFIEQVNVLSEQIEELQNQIQ